MSNSVPSDVALVQKVITHHIEQHGAYVNAFIAPGKIVVFYLGVTGATSSGTSITNFGNGRFTGPLKSATDEERKALVSSFPEATSLRQRLSDMSAPVLLISRIALDNTTHVNVAGLGVTVPGQSPPPMQFRDVRVDQKALAIVNLRDRKRISAILESAVDSATEVTLEVMQEICVILGYATLAGLDVRDYAEFIGKVRKRTYRNFDYGFGSLPGNIRGTR